MPVDWPEGRYLDAMRVPEALKPQDFGLWQVRRFHIDPDDAMGRTRVGFPSFTALCRATLAKLHLDIGEVVMEDTARELRRHLQICVHGRGRVLVSGLGLGCVVRGLLANQAVDHVDVVELDPAIIRIVGAEFTGNPRVTLHHGDALTYPWPEGERWDYAWHDCWKEGDGLQGLHAELMVRFHDRCTRQGAWNFPRWARRLNPRIL